MHLGKEGKKELYAVVSFFKCCIASHGLASCGGVQRGSVMAVTFSAAGHPDVAFDVADEYRGQIKNEMSRSCWGNCRVRYYA